VLMSQLEEAHGMINKQAGQRKQPPRSRSEAEYVDMLNTLMDNTEGLMEKVRQLEAENTDLQKRLLPESEKMEEKAPDFYRLLFQKYREVGVPTEDKVASLYALLENAGLTDKHSCNLMRNHRLCAKYLSPANCSAVLHSDLVELMRLQKGCSS